MTRVKGEDQFAWVVGPLIGLSEAMVIVFPILKIRDYFTEFEKKVFFSGLFLAIRSGIGMTIMFYLKKLALDKINIDGTNTQSTLFGFQIQNIAQMFQLLSYLTTVTALISWVMILKSERDNRFDGIDDTEGVVFISGNFSDEYEIDAESKLFNKTCLNLFSVHVEN